MEAPAQPTQAHGILENVTNWLSDLWNKLEVDKWFGDQYSEALRVSVYFVACFAVGFLFKKYLKYLLVSVILAIILIKGMEYYKILDIDWEALNTFLGFKPTATIGAISKLGIDWIKNNLVVSISAVLGFLLGYKLR